MSLHIKSGVRNRFIFAADLLFIIACVVGSYMLRFELGFTFKKYMHSMYWMIGVALVIKPLVYYKFGLYRRLWNYASIKEMQLILLAVTAASAIVSTVIILLASFSVFIGFPRSVLIIDWILSLIAVGGVRFSIRFFSELEKRNTKQNRSGHHRALIVGAGDAGAIVLREIQNNPQLGMTPVGFIDDDPKKLNLEISNVRVVGTTDQIKSMIDRLHVDDVFFAIPSAPGRVIRVVSESCRAKGVPFRTMPGIYELLGGKVNINRLREVEITDLLRRDPVRLDQDNIGPIIYGKVVLISGAGGSIGRELSRQIARWDPSMMVILGHGENSIHGTLQELQDSFPHLTVIPVIADIRDKNRLDNIFSKYRPQIVFHAAAHKHVYLMESNISDAITNNVLGTQNMVRTAKRYHAERFVMISTDKAVRPMNIMGATKRLAENIVLNESKNSEATYTVVRFGNVLGSRGSVVPLFKKQIEKGGPVTITDPQMERYFMTIPEAVYLVLESAGLGTKEETFVLDMGKQVRIIDLAEDLIRLSGLEPGRDIEIKITGAKPGEKLSEELWNEGQTLKKTIHPDIFKLDRNDLIPQEKLDSIVEQLLSYAKEEDGQSVRELLGDVIPDSHLTENFLQTSYF